MKKHFERKNGIILLLVLIFLLALCSLFPYSGDDWAWGSSMGIKRLNNSFANYNGRYIGNLIVLVLTRSIPLKIIFMAMTIFGIIYMSYRITNKDSIILFLLATFLMLAMPKYIFRQAIVWTSGFTNYVIPTLLILIYFLMNLQETKNKKAVILLNVSYLILGFISALFMEHVTIYIIVITIIMVIAQLIKKKKIDFEYVSYFIGSCIGMVIMFSNEAYHHIYNGLDTYRSISITGISSIIEKCSSNFPIIYKELILNNVMLNLVLTMLLATLLYKFRKTKWNKISKFKKILLNLLLFVIIGYSIYTLMKAINPNWNVLLRYTEYLEFIISMIFFLAILLFAIICVEERKAKSKIVFYWVSICLLTIPLLIVQPIGSRCFFTSYCIFILIVLEIYNYCMLNISIKSILNTIITTGVIVLAIYLTSIYAYIFKIDQERIKYLQSERDKGAKVIKVVNLPYEDYLHASRPKNSKYNKLEDRMKLFYNVPKETYLENITLKEWYKIKNGIY